MTKHEAFKRAVRVWLAERGKTQSWLALRIGVKSGSLSKVLSGYERSEPIEKSIRSLTGISVDAPEAEKAEAL